MRLMELLRDAFDRLVGCRKKEGWMGFDMKSPWAEYATQVRALFGLDDDVAVIYDNDDRTLKLYVDGAIKADAIARLLPNEVTFGNETLRISVIPSNSEVSVADLFNTAFANNPIFDSVVGVDSMGLSMTFALFEPDTVQYFSDDLGEYGGITTQTYAQLARAVFTNLDGNVRISSTPMGDIINN